MPPQRRAAHNFCIYEDGANAVILGDVGELAVAESGGEGNCDCGSGIGGESRDLSGVR